MMRSKVIDLEKTPVEIFNLPVYYGKEVYKEAIEVFISRISRFQNVKSVYQIGSISNLTPGISDLDFIVVLDDNLSSNLTSNKLAGIREGYNDKINYIIYHDVSTVLNESLFKEIHKLYLINQIRRVYGDEIAINPPGENEKEIQLTLLADYSFYMWPREFLLPLLLGKIDIRSMLNRLYSLRHPIRILQEVTSQENSDWNAFIAECRDLRVHWFEIELNSAINLLLNKLIQGLYFSAEIVKVLSIYLEKKFCVSSSRPNQKLISAIYQEGRKYYYFVEGGNPIKAINTTADIYYATKNLAFVVPDTLGLQLIEYAKQRGPWSTFIKRNLMISKKLIKVHSNPALHTIRGKIANQHCEFLLKQNLSEYTFYPLEFGFLAPRCLDTFKIFPKKIVHYFEGKRIAHRLFETILSN